VSRRKKTDESGWGFAAAVFVVLFIAFAVPTFITWLMYRKYQQLQPYSRGRKLCLVSMILSGVILYGFGIFFLKIIIVDGYKLNDIATWTPMIVGFCLCLPLIGLFLLGKRKARIQESGMMLYEEKLGQVLSDKTLNGNEIEQLIGISKKYSIPGNVAKEAHRSAYLNVLWDTSDDLKIDQNEKVGLDNLVKQLTIDDDLKTYSEEFIQKVNKINAIINGKLEGIEPPIGFILRKAETCFFYETCELYENVTSGAFVGTSFRLGKFVPQLNPRIYMGKRINYSSMKRIDKGIIAITNKKMVFLGNIYNREFTFDKILGLDVGYDGIQIRRSGKSKLEVFRMNALDKEIAVALIAHLTRTEG